MAKFADVLEDLVRNHGLTNVRWAEVGNEPNSGGLAAVSLAEFNALVRTLDEELRARGLRDQIRLMGPGLVENAGVPSRTHYVWLQWIAANMGDLFDAWAAARLLGVQRPRPPRVPAPGRVAPPERGAPAGAA